MRYGPPVRDLRAPRSLGRVTTLGGASRPEVGRAVPWPVRTTFPVPGGGGCSPRRRPPPEGAWTDRRALTTTWPGAFRTGFPAGARWEDAVAVLDRHDPGRVFGSPFVDALLSSG